MDEADRLAWRVLDAFERIPQLKIEWLIVPDEPQPGSVLEMEVAATESYFGNEVRADVVVPVEEVWDLSAEELERLA